MCHRPFTRMFFTDRHVTHTPFHTQTSHKYMLHRTDSYPHMFCFFAPTDLSPICVPFPSLVPTYVSHPQLFHLYMLFTGMFDVSPVCLSPTQLSPITHSLFTHTCCSRICLSPTNFLARCFSSTDFSHPLFSHMFFTHSLLSLTYCLTCFSPTHLCHRPIIPPNCPQKSGPGRNR